MSQINIVPKNGDEFIGDTSGGTILDGNNSQIASFESNGTVSNVTLANLTVQHYVNSAPLDALEKGEVDAGIDTGSGWILNNVTALNTMAHAAPS